MNAERLLIEHLPLLERVVESVARRHHLRSEDADELLAASQYKLVLDDYAVLRAYGGRSSMATYLAAVVQRVLLDQRNRDWGRWRPSAQAERLGPLAVRLERLMGRDGLSAEEACASLPEADRPTALALANQLPSRPRRRMESTDVLLDLPSPGPDPEGALLESERSSAREDLSRALDAAISELPAEDQFLVRMRLEEGLTLAEIARTLGRDARPLYRHYEAMRQRLRDALASAGIDAQHVAWALAHDSASTTAAPVERKEQSA